MDTALIFKSGSGHGGAKRYVGEIARWTDSPVFISYGDFNDYDDIRYFGPNAIRPLIKQNGISNFLDRLLYSTWTVPSEYKTIISSTFLGKLSRHSDSQHRIHLAHGYHRGAFGVPPRNQFSDNPALAGAQRLNRRLLQTWERRALSRMDTLVVNSQFTRDNIKKRYGITAEKVIHPPVDIQSYTNERPADEEFYLFLGRIAPVKGISEIVDAFHDLPHKLVVAGAGPLLDELRRSAPSNVDFRGYVTEAEKRRLVGRCKGFIQNSILEDFGITTVEALAGGSPVIAANTQNNPYLIDDRVNGVLFDTSDRVAGIKQGVRRAEALQWDHSCIQKSAREYSAARSRQKWEELLNRIAI